MKPSIDKRLQVLEERVQPIPILRIMRLIVEPDRRVSGIFAEGQKFEREEGESEEALQARARAALGWEDE